MPNMLKIRIGEIIQKAPNKDDPAKLDQISSGRPKAFRQADKQNYKYELNLNKNKLFVIIHY